MREEGTQNFTVNLDMTTYRRLKVQAVLENRPMIDVVRDSLRNYLDVAGTKDPAAESRPVSA